MNNGRIYISNSVFSRLISLEHLSKERQTEAIKENSEELSLIAFCALLCNLTSNGIIMTESDSALFRRLAGRVTHHTFYKYLKMGKETGVIKALYVKNGITYYKVSTPTKWRGRKGSCKIRLDIKRNSGFKAIKDAVYRAAIISFVSSNTHRAKLIVNAFAKCLETSTDPSMAGWFDYDEGTKQELSVVYKKLRMLGSAGDKEMVEYMLRPILDKYILSVSMKEMREKTGISKNRLNIYKKQLIESGLILRKYQYEKITEEEYYAYLQSISEGKVKVYVFQRTVMEAGQLRTICCKMVPNTYEITGAIKVVGKWIYSSYHRKVVFIRLKVGASRRRKSVKVVLRWRNPKKFRAL